MGGPPKLAFFVAARGRAEKHRPVRRQAYSMAGALPAGCCVVALADPGKPLKALAAEWFVRLLSDGRVFLELREVVAGASRQNTALRNEARSYTGVLIRAYSRLNCEALS
jgi:hypothetical protein